MFEKFRTSKKVKIILTITLLLFIFEGLIYLLTGSDPLFFEYRFYLYLYGFLTLKLSAGILKSDFVGEYIALLYGGVVLTLMFGPGFLIYYVRFLSSPFPASPRILLEGLMCVALLIVCVLKIVMLKIKKHKQTRLN